MQKSGEDGMSLNFKYPIIRNSFDLMSSFDPMNSFDPMSSFDPMKMKGLAR